MKVQFTTKDWFFDRPAVIAACDRAAHQVFSKLGAFIRKSARSLIRSRKRASAPGQPPSSRTGILRKFIHFAWDPGAKSLVVGPWLLPQSASTQQFRPGGETVPEILEYGGELQIWEFWAPRSQNWFLVNPRNPSACAQYRQRKRAARIAARPYMSPAFQKGMGDVRTKFPQLWSAAFGR